jgi:salicylate hydroxylase
MPAPEQRTQIAIVGAGITGLALAAALGRSGGSCTVFEQTYELGEVGAGLQLAPNAVRLLHRLGLAGELAAAGVPAAAIELRGMERGEVLGRIPLGAACEKRFDAPYYLLSRPGLHRSLLRLMPPGTVRLSMACTGVTQGPDGVELDFADGTRVTADLVVGTDGIRSTVRDHLIPDEPRYSGQTVYRGMIPAERAPFLGDEPATWIWAGQGRHFVCYPVDGGRRINFVATVPHPEWHPESWSEPGRVQDVLDAFPGWDPAMCEVIRAADAVTRWALHLREADFGWSRGRVTLAGDAAHPMLPFMAQGASQGIEDAFALAACLRDVPRDGITAALRRYEAVRRPRAALVQERSGDMSRVLASIFQKPGVSSSGEEGPLAALAWLFAHDAEELPADR